MVVEYELRQRQGGGKKRKKGQEKKEKKKGKGVKPKTAQDWVGKRKEGFVKTGQDKNRGVTLGKAKQSKMRRG